MGAVVAAVEGTAEVAVEGAAEMAVEEPDVVDRGD